MNHTTSRTAPEEILAVLADIFHEQLDFTEEVRPDLRLVEDIGLDSIRMLTLVVEVENHFHICLEEGDEQGVITVWDLAQLVGERLAA
jgi:acyl carrier protein